VGWAVTVGLTLGMLSRQRTDEGRGGDLDGRCARSDCHSMTMDIFILFDSVHFCKYCTIKPRDYIWCVKN